MFFDRNCCTSTVWGLRLEVTRLVKDDCSWELAYLTCASITSTVLLIGNTDVLREVPTEIKVSERKSVRRDLPDLLVVEILVSIDWARQATCCYSIYEEVNNSHEISAKVLCLSQRNLLEFTSLAVSGAVVGPSDCIAIELKSACLRKVESLEVP